MQLLSQFLLQVLIKEKWSPSHFEITNFQEHSSAEVALLLYMPISLQKPLQASLLHHHTPPTSHLYVASSCPRKKVMKILHKIIKPNNYYKITLQQIRCLKILPKSRVPVMVQWKRIWLGTTGLWVWSLASLSGLSIQCCHELWCRLQMQLGS